MWQISENTFIWIRHQKQVRRLSALKPITPDRPATHSDHAPKQLIAGPTENPSEVRANDGEFRSPTGAIERHSNNSPEREWTTDISGYNNSSGFEADVPQRDIPMVFENLNVNRSTPDKPFYIEVSDGQPDPHSHMHAKAIDAYQSWRKQAAFEPMLEVIA